MVKTSWLGGSRPAESSMAGYPELRRQWQRAQEMIPLPITWTWAGQPRVMARSQIGGIAWAQARVPLCTQQGTSNHT